MPQSESLPSSSGDEHLDEQCRQFAGALATGAAAPRLEDYLQGPGSTQQAALFQKLFSLELQWRIERGELPSAADYDGRFPDHRDLIERLLGQVSRVAKEGELEATIFSQSDDV